MLLLRHQRGVEARVVVHLELAIDLEVRAALAAVGQQRVQAPCEVGALLLQPLLENAFKHGVERSRDAVRIEVVARRDGERMHIAIRNTGSVLGPDREDGVGLRNCRERLSVLYGDAAQMQLTQVADAVEASVTLPWREHRA